MFALLSPGMSWWPLTTAPGPTLSLTMGHRWDGHPSPINVTNTPLLSPVYMIQYILCGPAISDSEQFGSCPQSPLFYRRKSNGFGIESKVDPILLICGLMSKIKTQKALWLSIVLQYFILLLSRNMSKNQKVVPIVVITGAICAGIYHSVTSNEGVEV